MYIGFHNVLHEMHALCAHVQLELSLICDAGRADGLFASKVHLEDEDHQRSYISFLMAVLHDLSRHDIAMDKQELNADTSSAKEQARS